MKRKFLNVFSIDSFYSINRKFIKIFFYLQKIKNKEIKNN